MAIRWIMNMMPRVIIWNVFQLIVWCVDGLSGVKIHVKPNQLILAIVYITQFGITTNCCVNGRGLLNYFRVKYCTCLPFNNVLINHISFLVFHTSNGVMIMLKISFSKLNINCMVKLIVLYTNKWNANLWKKLQNIAKFENTNATCSIPC
jgi:hypothetical protein